MGSQVIIREAKVSDAPLLLAAEQEITKVPGQLVSRPHELKLENYESKIQFLNELGNGKYLVLEENGAIVAHAYLDPLHLEAIKHVVHLSIAVHPGHQRKGYGQSILDALISWAKSSPQVEKIELQVRAVNARAISLYLKLGFTEEGRWKKRQKFPDGTYSDEVLMGLWVK